MKFSLIACIDNTNGIGKDNNIPWNFSKDLTYFKKITTTNLDNTKINIVIMGNNTYKSIPDKYKPLPDRLNIILSRSVASTEKLPNLKTIDKILNDNEAIYFSEYINLLLYLNKNKNHINEVFIIGGNFIYELFLKLRIISTLYITKIEDYSFDCDINLDIEKYQKQFKLTEQNIKYDKNKNNKILNVHKLNFCKYEYVNKEEIKYLKTINKILKNGVYNLDRTNVGTLSIFGKSFSYDIRNYRLPLFTHRKMFIRGIIEELLFFISGKTDTTILENKNVNIWKGNTSREFLDSRGLAHFKVGDMGAGYSFQLRHFGANYINADTNYNGQGFDQLQYIINLIKTDPTSRRIMFSYWNPTDFHKTALLPCHIQYNFYINVETNELSCNFSMRGSDFILANNYNVCSCAILVFMLCHITGYKPGKIVINITNVHIYMNHIEETKKMIENKPLNFPLLYINDNEKKITNIEDFKYEDFKILFYNSYDKYKFNMAV